jgi:lambda repressor-like predicted transcriptional regulator
METNIPRRAKINPKAGMRKPDFRRRVIAALMMRGMTLTEWARLAGYSNCTQVSLAMNQQRRHPKARMIRAELETLVKGSR